MEVFLITRFRGERKEITTGLVRILLLIIDVLIIGSMLCGRRRLVDKKDMALRCGCMGALVASVWTNHDLTMVQGWLKKEVMSE